MSLLHLAIISPLILAIFIPSLHKRAPKIHTGWFLLPLPVLLFGYFLSFLPGVINGEAAMETLSWIPSLGIDFSARVDGLGLLFALLITGIGALVVLYSIYYLSKEKEKLNQFYVYLLLFIGAMLGVVLSDNLIVLYAFWELTSFSSFLLIGYWNYRERSRYGAQKSMLITVFGGFSMLGGIVLLYLMTGTFSVSETIAMAGEIVGHDLFIAVLLCILLGAFTKSAQFPFHIWLPDAMEAPTPVSAYLHSATMVKAGIYLVARLTPVFAYEGLWIWLVAGFGIITLFWGSFSAVKHTDLKGILAYSTVSQLGLIMSLLGLGAAALHYPEFENGFYTVAITAAVFHLLNHATFKGSLFMMVGIVDHETGTRDIRNLGGLMTIMPITFTIAVIGSFSMAGLPPFNGFLSKEMFFTGMLRAQEIGFFNMDTLGILFPIIAWVASVFTFLYSMIIVFKTFTGKFQPEKLKVQKPHEAPIGMLISPIILVSLVVIIGFFPNIVSPLIEAVMASILPTLLAAGMEFDVHIYHWHGFESPELWMTIGVVIAGILLYKFMPRWTGIYTRMPERFSLNSAYDHGLAGIQTGANRFTNAYMTDSIRTYLIYIFAFFVLILGATLITKNAFALDLANVAEIHAFEVVLVVIIAVGSVSILFAKSRMTTIILLGAVGYAISLFYAIFRAPDLALTQLVIETISVALFLLAFYRLPKKWHHERMKFKVSNAIISVGVGLIVTLIALSAHSSKAFESISQYYVENTYTKAAGENMVNVILVDFRSFDTLFEIAVLGIAALGVFTFIKLRMSRGKEQG
ncbi:Na+/H+ antiporter subunit A [Bacillus sp. B15-48]|uniref:Na+/H+ antiporter subunit A n=1 Tax=Bacillus sp. B15-48 TaxID=1548601 RepID=UPI00193EE834|nr:Na+/H+ antiporter subunit A [Bacillus sp. B15-48]MBM4760711.1 Na+/H+ antiporter subunit A [Bacillus sp. B15-48]